MQRFYPALFVNLSGVLEAVARSSKLEPGENLDDEFRSIGTKVLSDFADDCRALDLTTSALTVGKLLSLLSKREATYGTLKPLIEELQGRVIDEMRGDCFFWLNSQESERYERWWKSWE